jgi:hypothetical protein
MDDRLRTAYRSKTKRELSLQLTQLQSLFHRPRHILQNRAQTLGLAVVEMKPWTDAEIEFVEENAGSMSLKKLAWHLRRNVASVKHLLNRKGLYGQCREGYSANELKGLLGVGHTQVDAWLRRGLLERSEDLADRITHESVRSFCLHYLQEISLRRVDERWLKMMVREELQRGWAVGRKAARSVGIDQEERRWA